MAKNDSLNKDRRKQRIKEKDNSISSNYVENSDSFKNSEQELSALTSMYEISKSLLSEHDLQKLLDTIAEKALTVLKADLVTLYEYSKVEDDVKIPPIIKGMSKAINILQDRGKVVPHKKSIIFKMLNRKQSFYAENAKEDWAKEGIISRFSAKKKESFFNRELIVSCAAIPLCIEDEVVGVLFVNYREFHRFTQVRKERIEIFANYAALAIHNARIFSKSQRYVKQLYALNEIGKQISLASTLNVDDILYLVYEQTKKLMDVTNFYIAFYDGTTDTVNFKLAIENGKHQKVGVGEWGSRKAGNGVTEYIIRTKNPIFIKKHVMEWLRSHEVDAIGKYAKSWMGAPMIVEDKVLGVIGVQSYEKENAYDEDDLNVLITIASQAAIAISKAFIFQQERDRINELDALYETSKEIVKKTLNTKEVLQAIVKRAVELSKANGGAILLCDNNRKELQVVVTHNLNQLLGLKVAFGSGMAGRVALSGKPMIQNEYHEWKGKLPIFKEKHYKDLVRAIVQVPLEFEGKIIGVLSMSSSEKNHKFTEYDCRILERFAVPAAIAIHNARIYSYLQTLIDDTPDAIIAVDTSGTVTEFNRASEAILGYRMGEVVGGSVEHLYWGGLNEARRINTLMKCSKNGRVSDVITFVKSNKGEKIPIRFAGSLLYNEYRERIGSVGHMEDLREIRLLEERYRALYEVGKIFVETQESDINIKKICKEFMDVLTKRVLNFKDSYLYLKNDDGDLELMASGGITDKLRLKSLFKMGHLTFNQSPNTSYLDIPLVVREKELGQIIVSKRDEHRFLEEEIKFLNRFASLAALVIDKAKDVSRSKKIAKTLQEITYDIVGLSGEDIFGDLWDKIKNIISQRLPNTNVCLYICDSNNPQLARLIECSSDVLKSNLKLIFYTGETPFKQEVDFNEQFYVLLEARSSEGHLEGFLLFEKKPSKDDLTQGFSEIDRLILSILAPTIGSALFKQRRREILKSLKGD